MEELSSNAMAKKIDGDIWISLFLSTLVTAFIVGGSYMSIIKDVGANEKANAETRIAVQLNATETQTQIKELAITVGNLSSAVTGLAATQKAMNENQASFNSQLIEELRIMRQSIRSRN